MLLGAWEGGFKKKSNMCEAINILVLHTAFSKAYFDECDPACINNVVLRSNRAGTREVHNKLEKNR